MASSNVEYYQRQKDLQDKMHESERKRQQLEAQLQAYCRSDEKLTGMSLFWLKIQKVIRTTIKSLMSSNFGQIQPWTVELAALDCLKNLLRENYFDDLLALRAKLRAVKLQSYWKKVCEDEKRSKQRNAQLLRDLDRMETNMANLEARREKLRQLKQQYWDYIDRTYPHWMELVEQQKREQQQQQHQRVQQQHQQQQDQQQQQQQRAQQQQQDAFNQQQQQQDMMQKQQQQQQELLRKQEQERLQLQQQQQEMAQRQEQQRLQQQEQRDILQRQEQERMQQQQRQDKRFQQQQQQQYQQIVRQDERQLQQQRKQSYDQQVDDESPPPLPSSPPPPLAFSAGYGENYRVQPEQEYTNLKDISRQSPATAQKQPVMASVTVHMPENPQGEFNTPVIHRKDPRGGKMEQPNTNWLQAERDPSVQSVSFSEDVSVPIIQPVQSVTVSKKQTEQKMAPPPDPGSDEDVSDFDDDDVPPPLPETEPPGQETQVKRDFENQEQDQEPESLSGVHPELSSQGLIHLLKYVEDDIQDALSVEGYYRTRNPDTAQRKDIIYKANSLGSLHGLDAEYVSMVVLEQLTPVIRSLPGACILPDTLLVRNSTITEPQIRSQLHRDVQGLWDKLLEHFVCLVKNRAMGTREVAYVFVPCLAHDTSQYQDKAVSLIERVVEQLVSRGETRAISPVQDSIIDTARSSTQNGVVPPLKFGSLVDSKPFSDEESSMITQSMPTEGPKVPLNETEAYKSLVSGSMGAKRPPPTVTSDDTDEDSDNDLEKQFVSTLSPRSHASLAASDHIPDQHDDQSKPSEKETQAVNESHDQSADLEPLSEVGDLPRIPPVYVPTAVERSTVRTGLGSTGGSSQQRRLAGMISSDIDTDTEVDIERVGMKNTEDDDDFHDFYQ